MYDLQILRELGCPESVIEHCIAVSKKALEIADRVVIDIDRDMIKYGALFHDIGRCKTHGVKHGVVGAEVVRGLGFPEEIVNIIERHIGAGITEEEAKVVGLPRKDYCPKTPEEKIVSYADILTFGTKYVTFEEGLGRYKKILGEDHPSINRFKILREEIRSWM